jgi:hypothetical protein
MSNNDLQVQQASSVMSVIEKAVANPEIDIEKMQQLLDLQERIMDKGAEASFNQAMVMALAEIPSFEQNTSGHKFMYASFESINHVVKPILAKHGLFMNFTTNFPNEGGVMVTAVITHKDGHAKQTTGLFPFDTSGSKNDIQAVGSAISYGKRYMQSSLLNITTHSEDDDGFASQKKVGTNEIANLTKGLVKAGQGDAGLCTYLEVAKLSEIPMDKYAEAVQFIKNIVEAKK